MKKLTTGIEVLCFVSVWLLIVAVAVRGGFATGPRVEPSRVESPLVVVVPGR